MPAHTHRPSQRRRQLTAENRRALEFIAAHRVTLSTQLAALLGVSQSAARQRLRRLEDAGLVAVDKLYDKLPSHVRIENAGLRAIGHSLPLPRNLSPRLEKAITDQHSHDIGLGWLSVAAARGALGPLAGFASEREMRSADTLAATHGRGGQRFAIGVGVPGPTGQPQAHYADMLLRTQRGRTVAIELELSTKKRAQLDAVMLSYAGDPRIDDVLYLAASRSIARGVIAAAERAGLRDSVHVQLLADGGAIAGAPSVRVADQAADRAARRSRQRQLARQHQRSLVDRQRHPRAGRGEPTTGAQR